MRAIATLLSLGVSACAAGPRRRAAVTRRPASAAHDTAAIRAAAAPRSEPTRVVSPRVTAQADTALVLLGEAGSNAATLVRVERQEECWRAMGEEGLILR